MSDRKYQHRGYQSSDEREPRREAPRPAGPREKPEAPRGRGLGKPTATVFRCAVCGTKQAPPAALDAKCQKCRADLHTCTHCQHFDTGAHHECRKPVEERVAKKAAANTCALFEAKAAQEFAPDATTPADARSAFDALFKL